MSSPRSHEDSPTVPVETLHWPPATHAGEAVDRGALRRWLAQLIWGVAKVNPALVLTATVAGAIYRYSLLWSVLLAIPVLASVLSVSARLESETRQGPLELLRRDYGRAVAIGCTIFVLGINLAITVASLMAVTEALSIILRLPRMFFVAACAFFVWYLLIFRDYRRITQKIAVLALPLLLYLAAAVLARPPWKQVISHTLIPGIPPGAGAAMAYVAIFGSLLTPCVLAWQTGLRRAEERRGQQSAARRSNTVLAVGLFYAIMIASATLLRVADPSSVTTRMAADALAPAVGPGLAPIALAIGIIGAGLAALPALIVAMCHSASQAMGWRRGMHENPWEAKRFYVLMSSVVFVAGAASFVPVNPVSVLYWSQVVAGVLMLPVLGFILLISNNRRLMHVTNSWWQNFWIGAGGGSVLCALLLALWWKLLR